MLHPIIAREFLVASRRSATWSLRLKLTGVALIICLFVIETRQGWGSSHGQRAFGVLAMLVFCHNLFAGAFFTGDSISSERRQGTLGLLYLTRLSSADFILGKLASSSLQAIFGQIALVPVLAVPVLAGGVDLGQLMRVCSVLILTLLFSIAAGMFASARVGQTGTGAVNAIVLIAFATAGGAFGGVFAICMFGHWLLGAEQKGRMFWLILILGCVLPLIGVVALQWRFLGIFVGSPFAVMGSAFRGFSVDFLVQLAALAALTLSTISFAVLATEWHHRFQGAELQPHAEARSDFTPDLPSYARPQVGDAPVPWLLARLQSVPLPVLLAAGLLMAVWAIEGGSLMGTIFDLPSLIPIFFFNFTVARYSAVPIYSLKQSGFLEELLTTPVTRADIFKTQEGLFWRLFIPLAVVLCALSAVPIFGSNGVDKRVFWIVPLAWCGFVLQARALSWLGVMYADGGVKPNAAASRAFLIAGLVPSIASSLLAVVADGQSLALTVLLPHLGIFTVHLVIVRFARSKLGLLP